MSKKKIGILPILGLIALTAGVTFAAIMWYIDVPMTFDIVSGYSLALYEDEGITPLTALLLGEISTGDSGDGGTYYMENTGSVPVYISYSFTDLPSGVTISVDISDLGDALLFTIIPGDTPVGPFPPGGMWKFSINYYVAPSAVVGTYYPTFTWNSHDVP